MTEVRLFTPGPTPVPPDVREAEALPMIHHRSEEFAEVLTAVRKQLRWLCGTKGDVAVFASSGTGGMEASVASLFSPGDHVVVVEAGKFGERWVDLAEHYDLRMDVVRAEWGRSIGVEQVMKEVNDRTRGVLIQACESSTGAYHPVAQLGRELKGKSNTLLVVDAITALGVHDVDMDRDGIDVLICASQKALMCAPGLATVAGGAKARERLKGMKPQSFYFSLAREFAAQEKGTTGFTPAVSLYRGLRAALSRMEKEGKEALYERHRKMQRQAREGLKSLGFRLVNRDEEATWGITAACVPDGTDAKAWIKALKKKTGLWLAGGQGKMEGKIFRMAHMGAITPDDVTWALARIKENLP